MCAEHRTNSGLGAGHGLPDTPGVSRGLPEGPGRAHRRRPQELRVLEHLRGRVAGQAVRADRGREELRVRPGGGPGRGDLRLAGGRPLPDSGSGAVPEEAAATLMGRVVARRGHLTLLPAGRAYRLASAAPAVVLIQTVAGPDTQFRWAEICQTA